jgi:cytochrome c5
MKTLPTILLCLAATACGDRSAPATEAPAAEAPQAMPVAADAGEDPMAKWARSCALCHVDGTGGAPRVGHPEEWQARIALGEDTLMKHATEGFNNMPPLGYCMSCSREDFAALIQYMSGAGS